MLGLLIRVLSLPVFVEDSLPLVSRVDYTPGPQHGEALIVLCENSWAPGTAGVSLCRVHKVLAAMSGGMKTDPRSLSKLYPAIVSKLPRKDTCTRL